MTKEIDKIEYTLLSNGLDFILSSLEYLQGKPSKRELKYAVLHLCSGIELVLKERLQLEHWSLVFDDPANAQKHAYEAGDFSSVSFKDCLKRLSNISSIEISDEHRQKLLRFRDKRNRLEHFGIVDSIIAIKASTAEALNIVIDFINSEFHPEGLNKEDINTLDTIRRSLGDFEEFVKKRLKSIKKNIRDIEAEGKIVVTCPRCDQVASIMEDGANCLFCGHSAPMEEAASEYISDVLGMDYYRTMKHGGEWPLYTCPDCETETLVDKGSSGSQFPQKRYLCFNCGYAWDEDYFDFCGECGQPYHGEMAICDRCFNDKISADNT